jgi:hypothetical protein
VFYCSDSAFALVVRLELSNPNYQIDPTKLEGKSVTEARWRWCQEAKVISNKAEGKFYRGYLFYRLPQDDANPQEGTFSERRMAVLVLLFPDVEKNSKSVYSDIIKASPSKMIWSKQDDMVQAR